MITLLSKALIYGCLGILIEFFFTSVKSLINKDWDAPGKSYLWMLPIHGFTAVGLEKLGEMLPWPFYFKAILYVPLIFWVEASSGWIINRLIGKIPWDYGKSFWTPKGLINLKYTPFWLLLAMVFDPIANFVTKVLNVI